MESEDSEIIIEQHPSIVEMVLTPADKVYAGTQAILQVRVTCAEKCDLRHGHVSIVDEAGAVVTDADLIGFDGEDTVTDDFIVKIPAGVGTYTWMAQYVPADDAEVLHTANAMPFTFEVIPHRIATSVWGVPIPVEVGGKFGVKVGAKCTAGCSLADLAYSVYDETGTEIGTGRLGEDPLSQTSGLMWSEQEINAPDLEGLYTWMVKCDVTKLELPHLESSSNFTLRSAKRPDRMVTVEVVDKERHRPIKGASIYVHPYRSTTDGEGRASIKLTGGTHELYVRLQDYDEYQATINVGEEDANVKVELFWAPDPYA